MRNLARTKQEILEKKPENGEILMDIAGKIEHFLARCQN